MVNIEGATKAPPLPNRALKPIPYLPSLGSLHVISLNGLKVY